MTHDILENSLELKKLAAGVTINKYWISSAMVLGIPCVSLCNKYSKQHWHHVARLQRPILIQDFDYYLILIQLPLVAATQTSLSLDTDIHTRQSYQLCSLILPVEETQKVYWSLPNLLRSFQLANQAENQGATTLNRIGYIATYPSRSPHDSVRLLTKDNSPLLLLDLMWVFATRLLAALVLLRQLPASQVGVA